MIRQGDIWWLDFGEAQGSEPGFERPAVVVQGDRFNESRIKTIIVVPLTAQLRRAAAPGNVLLFAGDTGLPHDSVANVTQIMAVDPAAFIDRAGRVDSLDLADNLDGIDLVLGRAR